MHVFVTIRQKISSLRPAIAYENFIFTQKYAFAERYYFLTFSFEGKLRKCDVSVKRKRTKINENMIFPALFTNFRETKILFFHAVFWRFGNILIKNSVKTSVKVLSSEIITSSVFLSFQIKLFFNKFYFIFRS